MRVSQERYTFTAGKNEFYVKDGWNADAERSARTLSGGESFLASLALALALADSVASFGGDGGQGAQIDALFLDEGVSSLDQDDTLPAVIDALSALQSGDRMICVISHMENLAERLPARIEIVKDHGRSSLKALGYRAQ
jgi:exonuclease SbcC